MGPHVSKKSLIRLFAAGKPQWSERALFGGLGGDPGSQRGSWGDIGGSADAYGAYLPTAGKYGSPGSFVPQARPLYGRAPFAGGQR